jgi:hypothetical protein
MGACWEPEMANRDFLIPLRTKHPSSHRQLRHEQFQLLKTVELAMLKLRLTVPARDYGTTIIFGASGASHRTWIALAYDL